MKSFYPVLYLCFLFGLLPFLGSCSEENESSGTIEMNQLPGTAQSFLSNYFPGQTPEKIERTNIDGNGFAFPEKLVASLPEKITEYISAHSNSEITRVDRSVAASFLVELTNGDGLMFDSQGGFLGKEKIELSISEKTYRYMRHQFPDDLNMYFSSYSIEGWIYKLGDGSQVRFDRDGNFVEMIAAAK